MASKRELKKEITQLSSSLFAECVAMTLYGAKEREADLKELLNSILRMNNDYIRRISHPEPGMKARKYYGNLIECFNKDVEEIVDHINNV